jgi:hypothetical protein
MKRLLRGKHHKHHHHSHHKHDSHTDGSAEAAAQHQNGSSTYVSGQPAHTTSHAVMPTTAAVTGTGEQRPSSGSSSTSAAALAHNSDLPEPLKKSAQVITKAQRVFSEVQQLEADQEYLRENVTAATALRCLQHAKALVAEARLIIADELVQKVKAVLAQPASDAVPSAQVSVFAHVFSGPVCGRICMS